MANNQLLASDNFASGSLAAGWSVAHGSVASQVSAGTPHYAEPPTLSTTSDNVWTGLTWPSDHASEFTLNLTAEATSNAALWVRLQSGALSGYAVNFTNSQFSVYRADAGVFTQLGSSVTGLTFTNGDVWIMGALGTSITVYQNNELLFRYMDATYSGGAPGFRQFSSTNLTHSRVASWRGYGAIQQDGIWAKQGILFPPLSADLSSGGGGNANASMIFDGNAQILSGNVFKMWFSAEGAGAENNCYYAESSDGETWERYGSAVLANYGSPFVIKNGTTYYMYAQPKAKAGAGAFDAFTSTDGLSWSLLASNILGALGGAGVWDGVVQWYFQPVAIIAGTWYALYSGGNDSTGYQLKLGLATSPDGETWTKSASNPVYTAANGGSIVNGGAIAQVGTTFYAWMFGSQPGQGAVAPNLDPGEGIRIQTTDFTHWTNLVHSVHRSQLYEGVNWTGGQSYPNGIFNIGGKTYMFIQSAVSDGQGLPSLYQFSLAIAPAPIASIVLHNEDGTSQVATEGFTSGIGDLDANWTTPTGATKLQIVAGNLCEATATSACVMCYTGAATTPNQYAECTAATMTSGGLSPVVRCQTGSVGYYVASVTGPFNALKTTLAVYSNVAGTFTQIGTLVDFTPQANDVYRLAVVTGSDGYPILTVYQNGFQLLQVEDYANTFTSGFPGLYISPTVSVTRVQASLWAGGNANVIPNYPSTGGSSSSWLTVANQNFLRGLKH